MLHPVVDFLLRHAGDPQRRGDVVVDGEIRIVDELLIDHRDIALLHRNARHVLAREPDFAGGRPVDAGHELHQRRLAGERRAEKDVERSLFELEVRLVDIDIRADALCHILEFKRHRPSGLSRS